MQSCKALSYADDWNIVHCDLKPQNILVKEGGLLKLADFGLSRVCSTAKGESIAGCGTLAYMSPE